MMPRCVHPYDNTVESLPQQIVDEAISRTIKNKKKDANTHQYVDPMSTPGRAFRIIDIVFSFINV